MTRVSPTEAAGEPPPFSPARQLAVVVARARVGLGAAMLALATPTAALALGSRERRGRVAIRLAGGRDLALGLGALTSLRERTQDAEWVSMGALVDGIDAVVLLTTPGLPRRTRVVGLLAAGCAAAGFVASRRLADEREQPSDT
jgi:hypothetical protein